MTRSGDRWHTYLTVTWNRERLERGRQQQVGEEVLAAGGDQLAQSERSLATS